MEPLKQISKRKTNYLAFLLFMATLLVTGFNIYDHYGVGWDEETSKDIGVRNVVLANHRLDYLFVSRERLEKIVDRRVEPPLRDQFLTEKGLEEFWLKNYGPFFEIMVTAGEFTLGLQSARAVYRYRHFMIFLWYAAGVAFFWLLLFHQYRDWRISLLGSAILVLCPRIFAHAFFNPKDIPFFTAVIVATYTLLRFHARPGFSTALFHSLACAIAIDIRTAGLLFFIGTIGLLFFRFYEKRQRPVLYAGAWYLVLTPWFVYLFWPYLWAQPLTAFGDALQQMSRYPWEGSLLFMGEILHPVSGLPWYYFPVWFGLTVPVFYLAAFIFFPVVFCYRLLRRSTGGPLPRISLLNGIAGLFFLAPWLLAVIMDSVLYDGWRHFYFVYPFFVILVVAGLLEVRPMINLPDRVFFLLVSLPLLWIAGSMIRMHPNQQVYFNCFAGDKMEERFEGDYWGISYYAGLQYLLDRFPGKEIKVAVAEEPGVSNALLLPETERSRLKYVDREEADFFMTTYRTVRDRSRYLVERDIHKSGEIFVQKVQDRVIMSVFQTKQTAE